MSADLFDIMPAELREHSEVLLELSDGKAVADYVPAGRSSRPTDVTTSPWRPPDIRCAPRSGSMRAHSSDGTANPMFPS